ncbi:MAG TPA: hypothetical protein PK425_04785 [Syntrophales bacterium]|jgi:hypothetical protein|nr:hypothetical protein [Syntrophales bacterium]HPX55838.1 hypothetical protein [Syntrophales bacterium]HQA82582.1 hypothetical protein [Syntrophales bacterium]
MASLRNKRFPGNIYESAPGFNRLRETKQFGLDLGKNVGHIDAGKNRFHRENGENRE